ncbi:type VII secretion system-associated protein [Streptomyces violascens]|uniref:type VII secretion system-associated protein n=1 Tax=Streptomyces violascens TaxID=67381 RepID=UPI0036508D3C
MSDPKMTEPPVTDAARAEAAQHPGSWVYAIDPFFEPAGRVPPYGIIGAWKADENGQLTAEFRHNPKYRRSPRSLGMKIPTDAVDHAVQCAAAGYADDSAVLSALLTSVAFLVPGAVSALAAASDPTARKTLSVYTSEQHAPTTVPELQRVDVRSLIARLPDDAILKLNPGSSASVEIPVEDLRKTTGP